MQPLEEKNEVMVPILYIRLMAFTQKVGELGLNSSVYQRQREGIVKPTSCTSEKQARLARGTLYLSIAIVSKEISEPEG